MLNDWFFSHYKTSFLSGPNSHLSLAFSHCNIYIFLILSVDSCTGFYFQLNHCTGNLHRSCTPFEENVCLMPTCDLTNHSCWILHHNTIEHLWDILRHKLQVRVFHVQIGKTFTCIPGKIVQYFPNVNLKINKQYKEAFRKCILYKL